MADASGSSAITGSRCAPCVHCWRHNSPSNVHSVGTSAHTESIPALQDDEDASSAWQSELAFPATAASSSGQYASNGQYCLEPNSEQQAWLPVIGSSVNEDIYAPTLYNSGDVLVALDAKSKHLATAIIKTAAEIDALCRREIAASNMIIEQCKSPAKLSMPTATEKKEKHEFVEEKPGLVDALPQGNPVRVYGVVGPGRPVSAPKGVKAAASGMSSFSTRGVRAPLSLERCTKRADTRKRKACAPCRIWKISCDPVHDGCCKACSKRAKGLPFMPSLQHFVRRQESTCFYRVDTAFHITPVSQNLKWTSKVQKIQLDMPDIPGAPAIQVEVNTFQPDNANDTVNWWRDQNGVQIEVPFYAAVNCVELRTAMCTNARATGLAFLESSITATLPHRFISAAFLYVDNNRNQGSIIQCALDIWCGSRMCAFDRSQVNPGGVYERAQSTGAVNYISPTLDYQCDMVTFDWMKQLGKKLMSGLWSQLVAAKKSTQWLEVFLSMFIMINNVEFIYGVAKQLRDEHKDLEDARMRQAQAKITGWLEQWKISAHYLLYLYTEAKKRIPWNERTMQDVQRMLNNDTIRSLHDFDEFCRARCPSFEHGDDLQAHEFDYEMYWARRLFDD